MFKSNSNVSQKPSSRARKLFYVSLFLTVTMIAVLTFALLNKMNLDSKSNASNTSKASTLDELTTAVKMNKELPSNSKGVSSVQSVEQLSKERKNLILQLMEENPALVLKNKITKDEKAKLPENIQKNIEEDTTKKGKIDLVHFDNFKGKKEKEQYILHGSNLKDTTKLFFSEKSKTPNLKNFSKTQEFTINGLKLDNTVLVTTTVNPPTLTTQQQYTTQTEMPGQLKTAVILFNFTNDTSKPFTQDTARSKTFTATDSTNNYLKENSNNKISLVGKTRTDGDIYDWKTVNYQTNLGCGDTVDLGNGDYSIDFLLWAEDAMTNAGFNINTQAFWDPADPGYLAGYNKLIFAFSGNTQCQWAGVSFLNQPFMWINGLTYPGYYSGYESYIVAHEFNHTSGATHALGLDCYLNGERVSMNPDGACVELPYEDPFDIQGNPQYHRHTSFYQKKLMGYVIDANSKTINTNGVYDVDIVALEHTSSGTQAVKIQRGTDLLDPYYLLEFRDSVGLDNFGSTDPAVNGLIIRTAHDYDYTDPYTLDPLDTFLIDTTPQTPTFNDAPLLVGKSFYDSKYKIKIETIAKKTLSTGEKAMTVRVTMGDVTVTPTPPAQTITPTSVATPTSTVIPTQITATPTTTAAERKAKGDFNNDGKVNVLDLSTLAADWGKTQSGLRADTDGDGTVGILDLSTLAEYWNKNV